MCMPRLRCGALIGAALFACGVILLVAAAATGFYYKYTASNNTVGLGMFKSCLNDEDPDNCSETIDDKCKVSVKAAGIVIPAYTLAECDKFNAIRAFLVIAVIVGGIAFLAMVYSAIGSKSSTAVKVGGIFAIISAILAMISMALGISWHDKNLENSDYGHSQQLAIAGWVVELVGGGVYAALAKA